MRFNFTNFKSICKRQIGFGPILFRFGTGVSQCCMQDHPVFYRQVSPPSFLHIFFKVKVFSNHLAGTCTLINWPPVMYLDPLLNFPIPRWGWSFWTLRWWFSFSQSGQVYGNCAVNLGLTGKCTYFLSSWATVLALLICSGLVNNACAGFTMLNAIQSSHQVQVLRSNFNWLSA